MVGYNPDNSVQLSHKEHVVAGGISGATSRAVGQPFDVLKIRFQLQVEPIKKLHSSKYHGLLQACGRIINEEGFGALWKGHVPAQGLSIVYGISQFALFEALTKSVGSRFPEVCTPSVLPVTHFICGGLSSSLTTFVVQPIDILRTRFVAQGEPRVYNSVLSAVRSIYKTEGFFAFYRGLTPALIAVSPQMGLQFGFYAFFTSSWKTIFGKPTSSRPGAIESLVCGSGSGLVAKLIIYPMDLVKKRLQIQGFEEARVTFGQFRHYKGFIDCLGQILKEEGFPGIYKGLAPSLLKAGLVAGVHLSIYEQVCHLFTLMH